MADLTTEYLGLSLKNPIIAGSSGLTDSVKGVKAFEENGAGAVVLKSIFEEEIAFEYEDVLKEASEEGMNLEMEVAAYNLQQKTLVVFESNIKIIERPWL